MEELIEKRYWNMGDLVRMFNCSDSSIRYHCKFFGISPDRTKGGYRQFNKADVEKLSNIMAYIKQGYHLKAIKNKL